MELIPWKEGKVEVLVPDPKKYPPTGKSPVFFNPRARLSRDLSVLILKVLRPSHILDSMCGTGIRGIRYAVEAGVDTVVFNDVNPRAIEVAEKNAQIYGIDAEFLREDVNVLLNQRRFLSIDLDPFGSPSPFLQATAHSIAHGGILLVTATDTSPLSGASPNSAMRKYHTVVKRIGWYREVAVRVLLGYVQHHLMVWEKALEPIFSFFAEHHVRIIGRVIKRPSAVTRSAKEMGIVDGIGPIWTGRLHDREVVSKALGYWDEDYDKRAKRILQMASEEIDSLGYIDIHLLSREMGISPPKVRDIVEDLREMGYDASRSFLEPRAIKTTAPPDVVKEVLIRRSIHT